MAAWGGEEETASNVWERTYDRASERERGGGMVHGRRGSTTSIPPSPCSTATVSCSRPMAKLDFICEGYLH